MYVHPMYIHAYMYMYVFRNMQIHAALWIDLAFLTVQKLGMHMCIFCPTLAIVHACVQMCMVYENMWQIHISYTHVRVHVYTCITRNTRRS